MRLKKKPHYKLHCRELARWLEQQGDDCWWSVDGDPLLMGRVSFPCPSGELADVLKRYDKQLLVQDKSARAQGQVITFEQLGALASRAGRYRDRTFTFEWEQHPKYLSASLGGGIAGEWYLIEDHETAKSEKRESLAAAGK